MKTTNRVSLQVPAGLVDAIRSFPVEREVEHCGRRLVTGPFDFYAQCPQCGSRVKLRAYSAGAEIEDVFDAVFQWMNKPAASEAAEHRRNELKEENGDEEGVQE